MNINIVYLNEFVKAYLTTDSPASHYGIPALRIDGSLPDFGEFDSDLGTSDVLPSGITAAELCCKTYHLQDDDTQRMSRSFCHQWPDGPQPGKPEDEEGTLYEERAGCLRSDRLENGRHYLMSVQADEITVEDALEAFGWTRNGLEVNV